MIFSQLTHYILPYAIHDIYVRLCHFRWTAFYLLCSTLMGCYYTTPTADMYRLLVAPLPPARLSAKKSEQPSRVSRLIHLYTKPSDIVYFDSSKRTILFLPVCAIYTQTTVGLYTLSVFWLRVMRQFVLYHLIKAPALFLMCLLLGYVGRLSSPLTHSSVIICGTLASHVTSAFRDAVESIRHVSGHILTHVLTTATTQHPTLIRIAGARFLILFDLGFMRLQSPAYSLSLISSTVLCIEFVWLDALKLKCLET